jgi:tRNA A37 threonylcarbamoyladenosine modification protein TsaB
LRIGIATIQGLALVHGRRVAAIPVLEALAHAVTGGQPEGALIGALMDAYRGDVFAALYRVAAPATSHLAELSEIEGPTVGRVAATLERWQALTALPALFVGDGATASAADIAGRSPDARVLPAPLLAGVLGRLATARAATAADPAAARPLYVRRPDVEILRDEKLRRG